MNFKKKMTHWDYSILPTNTLLEYWNTFERNLLQSTTTFYGKPHYILRYTEVDQLCEWVHNREKIW